MFFIEISNKRLRLLPGNDIQMERNIDFFKLLRINGVYSYELSMPREGNECIFYQAGDMAHDINRFIDYPATVGWNNNALIQGTFTLQTSIDNEIYRGTFTSLPSVIYDNLQTSLKDILDEYDATLYAQSNISITTVNDSSDPWVKFPLVDTFFSTQYNLNNTSQNIHFFQMIELTCRTLRTLGYTLVDMATTTGSTAQKIYFPGRRITANTKELSDICPDMTVAELLKTFAILVAGDITILEGRKEVVIYSWDRMIDDPREIDLTTEIYSTEVEVGDISGIKFNFDTSSQTSDLHVSENPSELQGTLLADVADIDSLPSGSTGDYCFVILENAWYKYGFNESTNQEQWDFYANELFSRDITGAGTSVEITCPSLPMHRDRYVQIPTLQHNFTITDNSGSVRITITSTNFIPALLGSTDLLRIPGVYDEWVSVTGYDGINDTIDIDVDYIEDATYTGKVFHVRNQRSSYMPQVDNSLNEKFPADYDAKINASFAKRVVLWHGSQLIINSGSSIEVYIATSDNIDNRGNKVADYALRWNGPDNLIDAGPWARPVAFANTQPRIFTHYAWVKSDKLDLIMNTVIRKVRSREGLTLMRNIRYLGGKNDEMLLEIQGYRL